MEVINLNFFPNGEEEIALIKFVSQYQYLNTNDAKYFFKTVDYYKKRIKHLVDKKFIKRSKSYLILDELGIEYTKLLGFDYNPVNRNAKYKNRLLNLSNIGAFYHNCKTVKFTPSFSIKDKQTFTTTGRRYIGVFDINGIEYLGYQIRAEHDEKYIKSIMYDIQKEIKYKNIIILVNDIKRINFNDFCFGINQVVVLQDSEKNREKLKYLNSVNWYKIINEFYKNKAYLSEYNFCDYTDYKNKYISYFYFLDTEKINRIKYFLRENENKNIDIICDSSQKEELSKVFPNAHYIILSLEKYIDKERNYYD